MMMTTFEYESNVNIDFYRETIKEEIDYTNIIKTLGVAAVFVLALVIVIVSMRSRVIVHADASTNKYFGDEVSSEEFEFASSLVNTFFEDKNISNEIGVLRSESKFTYDNSDTEARAVEMLVGITDLFSIDYVVSIEDEYRVYVTIKTVNVAELMNSNRGYLSQAFCSDRNSLTEDGINRVLLQVIEKDAEADCLLETYITVKDSVVDAEQFVGTLRNLYSEMRSVDL